MKVTVVYKGGIEHESFECEHIYAHSSGGWFIKPQNIFISSADVRKILISEAENI